MADEVVTLPGTGEGVAVDKVSGVDYQLMKLVDATEDSIVRTGVSGHGLRVDPTGTTAQPVTDNGGSLTVDNGGTFAVQATLAAGATNVAKAEDVASADADVGVPAMAVRKASPANTSGTDGDYEMLQMSAGRLWASATIDSALPAGTAAIGKLAANDGVDIGDVTINNASGGSAVNIQDGGNSITVDGSVTADTELPSAGALADGASNPTTPTVGAAGLVYNGSTWDRARGDTTNGAWVNVKAGTVTSSGSDSTPNVNRKVKVTATLTSVNDTGSNTTLLASNSNRLGFTMVNDSTSILYVRLSASAAAISAGSYNYILQPGDTLEHPGPAGIYTGAVTGIWSVDASGWVAITEYT